MKIAITGNPGTGKHTSASLVAERLGAEIVDINSLAIENGAIISKTGKGLEVDVKRLSVLLRRIVKRGGDFVIVGHLVPYVLKKAGIDMVVVLRRHPSRLEETLLKRGYVREKINENISAEVLGISLYDSIGTFGKSKIAEFDTTGKTPEQTAEEIVATVHKKRKRHVGSIDWLAVISEDEVKRFFAY